MAYYIAASIDPIDSYHIEVHIQQVVYISSTSILYQYIYYTMYTIVHTIYNVYCYEFVVVDCLCLWLVSTFEFRFMSMSTIHLFFSENDIFIICDCVELLFLIEDKD